MAWTPIDMYSSGLEFFGNVVEATAGDAWQNASPCDGWSALDVLGHVGSATAMGVHILRGEEMTFAQQDSPSSAVEGDPRSWWASLATTARDAIAGISPADLTREVDTPMGRRTVGEGLSFPAVDLFFHAWDLAAATGRSVEFPDEAVEFIRAMFEHVPAEATRRPGVFADPLEAPEGASSTEQLIAWSGRVRPSDGA